MKTLMVLLIAFACAATGLAQPSAAAPPARVIVGAGSHAARDALLESLAGTRHRVAHRYGFIPFAAVEAGPDALAILKRSRLVRSLEPDSLDRPLLAESTEIIRSAQTVASGLGGAGVTIAVLDSGVDRDHLFLTRAIVEEACFSEGGGCPNGRDTDFGSFSAMPCDFSPDCRHGTHVAGIALGRRIKFGGIAEFSGVAPDASLYAIRVARRESDCLEDEPSPCVRYRRGDTIAALDRVYTRRTLHRIAAVNLSFGGSVLYDSRASCDASESVWKASFDKLRSAEIAVVAASGNEDADDGIQAPACLSSAVAVGATDKEDQVWQTADDEEAAGSNSAPYLDLLAPGRRIFSSEPGNAFGMKTGTSMASPHVAGAFAVLKSMAPDATVGRLLEILRGTGDAVTDPRNDVTTPRIDVWAAVARLGTIRVSDVQVKEDAYYARFTVTLARSEDHTVSVWYETEDGSARAPSDYASRSGRLDFSPGQTAKTVYVRVNDDDYREGAETFTLRLTASSGARRNRSTGTATIAASDPIWSPPQYEGGNQTVCC